MGKHYNNKQSKHAENAKNNKILIAIFILILIIIIAVVILMNLKKDTGKTEENIAQEEKVETTPPVSPEELEEINEIPDKMGEFHVQGVLVIDKLNLRENILNKTNDSSLALSITKFRGPNLNTPGNYCITGHDYMAFKKLDDLEKEDTFYIIDKENFEKVTYKVYDKFAVEPEDLACTESKNDGKREVTLITCTDHSKKRLIIKACEV